MLALIADRFRTVVTFDDWANVMRAQENQLISTIYFVIFILTGRAR